MEEPEPNFIPPVTLDSVIGRKVFQQGFISGRTEFDDVITNSIRFGAYFVRVKVGENINTAINKVYANGGGTVFLEAGTHKPNYDIIMKEGVILSGQARTTTIIDFNSGSYQIVCQGTDAYTTGTISATYGDATITGALTVWTSAMQGTRIQLDGSWYTILSVTDQTHLEIAIAYAGQNLTGASYAIANDIKYLGIKNMMIRNSAIASVKVIYVDDIDFEELWFQQNLISVDADYAYSLMFRNVYAYFNTSDAYQFTNCAALVFKDSTILGNGGNGITLNTVTNSVIETSVSLGNTGDGLNITSCTACGISGATFSRNGSNGIEFVSGNSGLSIIHTGCFNNTSDGIKLTTNNDYNSVTNCILHNNGGYGWNIANANCNGNVMIANNFYNNTSGTYNDSGTGTVLVSAG